ncbi:MAG: homoserine/homoserine lactone efflux protein [Propionivibrio sp.]
MTLNLWLAFVLAAILIAVSPGPGAALSMSAGLRHGQFGALPAIFGLQAALLIQLAIVGMGLGAVLAASATAFAVVKFAGAAYLVWLGVQKWRRAGSDDVAQGKALRSGLFRQGLLVNLTNPKAIVFMAALTPQFIDPNRPQLPQFLIIALTMCVTDTIVMSGYALLASRLGTWLHDARARRAQDRFFGGLFIGAGALLATSSRH